MTIKSRLLLIFLSITLGNSVFAANKEFPGRDLYPNIPYLEMDKFYSDFKTYQVVDVRSEFEYRTLHIKGAKNVPLASKTFVKDLRALREKSKNTIVVYCNGRTCMKSYKAARKAKVGDIKDVVAFDAGIMDWSKAHPDLAILLSEPLRDASKLISKNEFEKHLIPPDAFSSRMAESEDIVLDVRDRFQREGLSIFVGREYRVSLDNERRLLRFIKKAEAQNKGLLIYDAAGKQVRWLQYYLVKNNVKNYYFMKGGIRAYYSALTADMAH